MGRLGMGVGRRRRAGPRAAPPAAAAPPPGFALNGSGNPALRAMLARVAAGQGRGRIVMKGDSTTAGAGAGGNGDVAAQLANARPGRPSATLAAQLSGVGHPARDGGFVGDNGCKPFAVALEAYDPRISFSGPAWAGGGGDNLVFAGGNYLVPSDGGILGFAESGDRFEVVCYNVGGTFGFAVDGAVASGITAPGAAVSGNDVTMPSTGGGFTRITVPAGADGPHMLGVVKQGGGTPLLRSVTAYGPAPAIDILNHAASGASSAHQAASGGGWLNNDALAFDAPDLTIVNLGLNDGGQGGAVAAYAANLQAIVDTARLSGDVLLVSPTPANPAAFSPAATQAALRDAAAALAASNGAAFMDLGAYFGPWASFAPRTADGTVHPDAAAYREIGEVFRRCVQAMAA